MTPSTGAIFRIISSAAGEYALRQLPPATYAVYGRQFVVVAAGFLWAGNYSLAACALQKQSARRLRYRESAAARKLIMTSIW